jgi:hypothetical protein
MSIKSVRIGAFNFSMKLVEPSGDDTESTLGTFCFDGIKINKDQEPSMMASTIIHECIHAMYHVYHIPENQSEEDVCGHLEAPFMAFLRDNGPLVRAIMKACNDGTPIKLLP